LRKTSFELGARDHFACCLLSNLAKDSSQWENISITSIEVDFWGVKSGGCENSHAYLLTYMALRPQIDLGLMNKFFP
jgi:hypothetical protein